MENSVNLAIVNQQMLLLGNESMPNKALEDLPLGGIIAFHLL
jgi:hypothetical protein